MSRVALGCAVVALAACPSKRDAPGRGDPPPPPPAPSGAPRDAGVTTINGYDPASGMHLDDDGTARPDPSRPRPRTRTARQVDILLKSTPTGALASVDGTPIGPTPTYWTGDDGREHDFTFVLPHHALAHYRFVPITSGTVHARLERIADELTDGGIAPAPPPPTFTPDAAAPMAPDAALRGSDAADRTDPMPPEDTRGGAGPKP